MKLSVSIAISILSLGFQMAQADVEDAKKFSESSGSEIVSSPVKPKKKLKYLQDVMPLATADEKMDLVKLLDTIEVTPLKQKINDKPLFRVRFVEKGSVFDRAGYKRGDIITTGFSPSPDSNTMTK